MAACEKNGNGDTATVGTGPAPSGSAGVFYGVPNVLAWSASSSEKQSVGWAGPHDLRLLQGTWTLTD